ncbi:transcriptional regulator, TetR family [Sphingomonas laterariae]|uniref:Transcriptional regulator, TetR family n=1 Tax=Edaphosphingomonas laterariae TaxID=861865 RepID=A0A239C8G4_9SPHN|nr:TetR/AcrR family transcriptional regulator [Sphingomonas laterariae]SNS15948.1 transcriptional regulator, TetR family [Sphingomonas laterariae]
MTRQAGKVGRPRSEGAERAILDATLQLLASEGYAGFTLDKVAALARVSKATIYRRWPSKEHLVIAAFDRSPPLTPDDKGGLVDDLIHVVLQFINVVKTTPLLTVLPVLVSARSQNPALAEIFNPWLDQRRAPVKQIVERAVARGDLPKALDLDMAEDMVMGPVILRLFFYGQADLGRVAVRELVIQAVRGMGGEV